VERSTPTNRSHAEVAATEDAVTNDNDAKVADLIEEPPAGRLNKKRKKYHPPGYAADFVDVPYFNGSPSYQPSQVVQGIIDVVGVIPQRERSTIFPFDVAHVGSDEMRGRLLNMYLARFFMDVFSVYSGVYMTHKYDQQRSLRYNCTTESCSFTVLFLLHKRTRDACKMKVGELRQVVLRHSSHCPHSHPPSEGCRIDLRKFSTTMRATLGIMLHLRNCSGSGVYNPDMPKVVKQNLQSLEGLYKPDDQGKRCSWRSYEDTLKTYFNRDGTGKCDGMSSHTLAITVYHVVFAAQCPKAEFVSKERLSSLIGEHYTHENYTLRHYANTTSSATDATKCPGCYECIDTDNLFLCLRSNATSRFEDYWHAKCFRQMVLSHETGDYPAYEKLLLVLRQNYYTGCTPYVPRADQNNHEAFRQSTMRMEALTMWHNWQTQLRRPVDSIDIMDRYGAVHRHYVAPPHFNIEMHKSTWGPVVPGVCGREDPPKKEEYIMTWSYVLFQSNVRIRHANSIIMRLNELRGDEHEKVELITTAPMSGSFPKYLFDPSLFDFDPMAYVDPRHFTAKNMMALFHRSVCYKPETVVID